MSPENSVCFKLGDGDGLGGGVDSATIFIVDNTYYACIKIPIRSIHTLKS